MKPKQPAGPPMTLGNMRELGVQRLVAHCLNPSCRHESPIEAFSYHDPYSGRCWKLGVCGGVVGDRLSII